MIPVDQTRFGGPLDPPPRGNCFAACVASVLEVPLAEAPEVATGEEDWMAPVRGWLARRNLQLVSLDVSKGQAGAGLWGGYGLLLVPSRTLTQANGQPAWHQVVWHNGVVVHDPSPVSRALGTYTATDGVELAFFVALDPARVIADHEDVLAAHLEDSGDQEIDDEDIDEAREAEWAAIAHESEVRS